MFSNQPLLTSRQNIQNEQLHSKLVNLVSPMKPIRLLVVDDIPKAMNELSRNGHSVLDLHSLLSVLKERFPNSKTNLLDSFLRTEVPASKKEDQVMLCLLTDIDASLTALQFKLGIEIINIVELCNILNSKAELSANIPIITVASSESKLQNIFDEKEYDYGSLVNQYINSSFERYSIERMVCTNSTFSFEKRMCLSDAAKMKGLMIGPFYGLLPDAIVRHADSIDGKLYPGQNSNSSVLNRVFDGYIRMLSIFFNIQVFQSSSDMLRAFKENFIRKRVYQPLNCADIVKYVVDCVGGSFGSEYCFPLSGMLSSDAAFGKLMRLSLSRMLSNSFFINDGSHHSNNAAITCLGSEDESLSQFSQEDGLFEHTNIELSYPMVLTEVPPPLCGVGIRCVFDFIPKEISSFVPDTPFNTLMFKLYKSSGPFLHMITANGVPSVKNENGVIHLFDTFHYIELKWQANYAALSNLKHFKLFCIRCVNESILPVGMIFSLPYLNGKYYLQYIDEECLNRVVPMNIPIDDLCYKWQSCFLDEDFSRNQAMRILSLNTVKSSSIRMNWNAIATFSISNTLNTRDSVFEFLGCIGKKICCVPNIRCANMLLNRDIEFTVTQDHMYQLIDHHKNKIVSDWCYDPTEFCNRGYYVYDLRDILSKLSWFHLLPGTFGGLNGNDALFSLWMVVSNYELLDSKIQTLYNTQTCYVKIIPEMLRVIFGNDSNSLYDYRKLVTNQTLGSDAIDTGESEIAAFYEGKFLNVSGHLADMLMFSSYHIIDFNRYFMLIENNINNIGRLVPIEGLSPERDVGQLWHNLLEYEIAIKYARFVCRKFNLLLNEDDITLCERRLNKLRSKHVFLSQSYSGLRTSMLKGGFSGQK